MENNKEEEEFKIPIIKSSNDLNKIFDAIYEQGFGYVQNQDNFHKSKIEKIIQKYNVLKIDVPSSFYAESYKIKNYAEAEKEISAHFSKFNPDDKINEFIKNKFSIKYDDRCKPPEDRGDNLSTVVEWFKFKTKYNLIDKDYKLGDKYYINVDIYNLDKKSLKIHFGDNNDFKSLYKLIFNKECAEITNKLGEWQNLGEIELKFFQNGTASIKGNLTKIKEYYYKDLMSSVFYNSIYIIYYNNKIERVNPKK